MHRSLAFAALVVATLPVCPVARAQDASFHTMLMSDQATAPASSTPPAAAPSIAPAAHPAAPSPLSPWLLPIATLCGLLAYAVRAKAPTNHWLHDHVGAGVLALGGAFVAAALSAIAAALSSPTVDLHAVPLIAVNAGLGAIGAWVGAANPSKAAGMALLALLLFAMPGCAQLQRAFASQPVALQQAEADALHCGEQAVQQEMVSLSPTVLDALAGDSPDWKQQLTGLEAQGSSALLCAVSHALYDALGAGGLKAIAARGLEHAVEARLLLADTGQAPLPTPSRRVLARGLEYLQAHLPARAHATRDVGPLPAAEDPAPIEQATMRLRDAQREETEQFVRALNGQPSTLTGTAPIPPAMAAAVPTMQLAVPAPRR